MQLPIFGGSAEPEWSNITVAPFIDLGVSWDEVDVDLLSGTRNTNKARMLLSVGAGFIWEPFLGLRAQLYYGLEVADNFNGDDPRDRTNTGGDSRARKRDLQSRGVQFAVSYVRTF